MKKTIIYAFAGLLALSGVSCSMEETTPFLRLSMSQFSFDADGSDTCKVVVDCNGSYTIENDTDWIFIEDDSEGNVRLTVSQNDETSFKNAKIAFVSGNERAEFSVEQMPFIFDGKFEYVYNVTDPTLSRNGRWFAGCMLMDGSENLVPFRLDLETGEMTTWPEYARGEYDFTSVWGITDDGNTMILANSMGAYSVIFQDGEILPDLEFPDDDEYIARYQSISADGSVVVGYLNAQNDNKYPLGHHYIPCRWVNGEIEILEAPDFSLTGGEIANGVMARGCSADGSVIFGSEWDYFGAVVWKDGVMNYIGGDPEYNEIVYGGNGEATAWSGIITHSDRNRISPDGRYIAFLFRDTDLTYYAAMTDLQTGRTEIVDIYGQTGGMVTNDGDFIYGNINGMHLDMDGNITPLDEWYKSKFGITLSDDYIVTYISTDYKSLSGMKVVQSVNGITYSPWYIRFR